MSNQVAKTRFTLNCETVEIFLSHSAVIDTSVERGIIDCNVVYHQILVHYRKSWIAPIRIKSNFTMVNEFLIVPAMFCHTQFTHPVNIFVNKFCGTMKLDRLSDLRRSIIVTVWRI